MKKTYLMLIIALMFFTIGCSENNSTGDEAEGIEIAEEIREEITEDELYLFKDKETNLYGYMNYKGKIIIEPEFVNAYTFISDGFANVVDKDGISKIIDKSGEAQLESEENRIVEKKLTDDLFIVIDKDVEEDTSAADYRKRGIVNKDNKVIVEYGKYKGIYLVNNNKNIYILHDDDKYEILDLDGNIASISDSDYKNVSENIKEVIRKEEEIDERYYFSQSEEKFLRESLENKNEEDVFTKVKPDWAADNQFIICNSDGEEVIDGLYVLATEYKEINRMITLTTNGEYRIFDLNGEEIFEFNKEGVNSIIPQIEGIYAVLYGEGNLLWIDSEGKEIIPE